MFDLQGFIQQMVIVQQMAIVIGVAVYAVGLKNSLWCVLWLLPIHGFKAEFGQETRFTPG